VLGKLDRVLGVSRTLRSGTVPAGEIKKKTDLITRGGPP